MVCSKLLHAKLYRSYKHLKIMDFLDTLFFHESSDTIFRASTKREVCKKLTFFKVCKIDTVQRGIILSIPLERWENFTLIWCAQFFSTLSGSIFTSIKKVRFFRCSLEKMPTEIIRNFGEKGSHGKRAYLKNLTFLNACENGTVYRGKKIKHTKST